MSPGLRGERQFTIVHRAGVSDVAFGFSAEDVRLRNANIYREILSKALDAHDTLE